MNTAILAVWALEWHVTSVQAHMCSKVVRVPELTGAVGHAALECLGSRTSFAVGNNAIGVAAVAAGDGK